MPVQYADIKGVRTKVHNGSKGMFAKHVYSMRATEKPRTMSRDATRRFRRAGDGDSCTEATCSSVRESRSAISCWVHGGSAGAHARDGCAGSADAPDR